MVVLVMNLSSCETFPGNNMIYMMQFVVQVSRSTALPGSDLVVVIFSHSP